ncbi:MAG: succinate dehydrogenase iron-sulfur subunit [Chloroflexi bacterium]|nr:succinate dehydrogenase iron-sulfur subunit [Chloroflexota bacterium]MCH8065447.1 succinate dehydrogenase iron-sulfur subunit [Chloroflexota bacterium]
MKIALNVKRFDPEAGNETRNQQYAIDLPEHSTVLDALIHVREYVDATLALRCSCRSAICGSCAMRVDKQACLACKTKITDIVKEEGQEILVEPMGNMPVIKDLVTDMEVHWSKVRQVTPWLRPTGPEPEREYLVSNDAMMDVAGAMNCIHCGACVSDCPVLEIDKSFIAPAALAKAYRFAGDPRDGTHKERLQMLSETQGGIWDCTRCNMCVEVCPKDVRPMDLIMQLRDKAVAAGVAGGTGKRHGDAFSSSVRRLGRLDEMRLLPESVGIFNAPRLLGELRGAFRMMRVGKLPWKHALPLVSKPIPGIKHVRRLFDQARREEKETKE